MASDLGAEINSQAGFLKFCLAWRQQVVSQRQRPALLRFSTRTTFFRRNSHNLGFQLFDAGFVDADGLSRWSTALTANPYGFC